MDFDTFDSSVLLFLNFDNSSIVRVYNHVECNFLFRIFYVTFTCTVYSTRIPTVAYANSPLNKRKCQYAYSYTSTGAMSHLEYVYYLTHIT